MPCIVVTYMYMYTVVNRRTAHITHSLLLPESCRGLIAIVEAPTVFMLIIESKVNMMQDFHCAAKSR